jgi:hypothetical protein
MIPVNKKLLKLICMAKHVVLLHVHVKQLGAVYVRHTIISIKGTDIKETYSYNIRAWDIAYINLTFILFIYLIEQTYTADNTNMKHTTKQLFSYIMRLWDYFCKRAK